MTASLCAGTECSIQIPSSQCLLCSCMKCLDILLYTSDDENARVCDFQSIPTHPDFQPDKVFTYKSIYAFTFASLDDLLDLTMHLQRINNVNSLIRHIN